MSSVACHLFLDDPGEGDGGEGGKTREGWGKTPSFLLFTSEDGVLEAVPRLFPPFAPMPIPSLTLSVEMELRITADHNDLLPIIMLGTCYRIND